MNRGRHRRKTHKAVWAVLGGVAFAAFAASTAHIVPSHSPSEAQAGEPYSYLPITELPDPLYPDQPQRALTLPIMLTRAINDAIAQAGPVVATAPPVPAPAPAAKPQAQGPPVAPPPIPHHVPPPPNVQPPPLPGGDPQLPSGLPDWKRPHVPLPG